MKTMRLTVGKHSFEWLSEIFQILLHLTVEELFAVQDIAYMTKVVRFKKDKKFIYLRERPFEVII